MKMIVKSSAQILKHVLSNSAKNVPEKIAIIGSGNWGSVVINSLSFVPLSFFRLAESLDQMFCYILRYLTRTLTCMFMKKWLMARS